MQVADAQREVRNVFRNGAIGQLVSGAIWLASATFSSAGNRRLGVLVLVIGGAFIFLITRLVLTAMRRPNLSPGNPLTALAMQVAFIVPLTLPVVGGAALHNPSWFYPGVMIVVGTHYMPFIFLYGLWQFAVLAAALIGGGITLAFQMPHEFALGGWLGGGVLVLFGLWLFTVKESPAGANA